MSKILDNGIYRELTLEEIKRLNAIEIDESEVQPTLEERLEALEAVLLEQILGGSL